VSDLADVPLADFSRAFEAWIARNHDAIDRYRRLPPLFADRVRHLQDFQAELYEAGWARHGWPIEVGGLGGTVLHRAAVYDVLARSGFPGRSLFEHVEILIPALARYGHPDFATATIPRMLDGSEPWCQGFSEPDAGSDLAALRTTVRAVDGGLVVTGRKIWTSWAVYARWCMLLARSGTAASRHRGLTMLAVPMSAPGVTVRGITQANGLDELAEVTFDDVFVPSTHLIGAVDAGWQVAMHVLENERGTFAWQRHGYLFPRLEQLARADAADHTEAIGAALCDLVACRARALRSVRSMAGGEPLGPSAAVDKLLLIRAEQQVYDVAAEVLGPDVFLGLLDDASAQAWQEDWYFSRAISIYGGTEQIQRNLVAERVLGLRTP
jgi:alkylation response protein AidB-like acyl-CoA dehydrogenase